MKKIIGALVVIVVLILIFVGMGKKGGNSVKNTGQGVGKIKIGAVLPLTGPGSGIGEIIRQGYALKVAELQEAGVDIEYTTEDFATDPKQAVSAFNSLVDVRKTNIIFVTTSVGGMVLKPLAAQRDVLLWVDATHPDVTKDSTNIFRHANVVPEDVKIVSDSVIGTGAKKVAIIYQQDDWGVAFNKSIADIFASKGIAATSEGIDGKASDFRSALSKVKAGNPDGVVIAVYGGAAGLIVKQIKELGYKGNLFQGVGFILTPDAQKIAGDYANGMYYQDYPVSKEIADAYEKRFGTKASPIAYIAYTDLEIVMHAINETKSTEPKVLIDFIKKMGTFQGKYEKVTIQPNGDIIVPTTMKVWGSN